MASAYFSMTRHTLKMSMMTLTITINWAVFQLYIKYSGVIYANMKYIQVFSKIVQRRPMQSLHDGKSVTFEFNNRDIVLGFCHSAENRMQYEEITSRGLQDHDTRPRQIRTAFSSGCLCFT